MSGYSAYITYSRTANPVRIIEIMSMGNLVDVLHPNDECEDWRDAEPVLRDAGWRVVEAPHPSGTQVFPVGRVGG